MNSLRFRDVLKAFVLVPGLAFAGAALAQTTATLQVLDTVTVFGQKNAVQVDFSKSPVETPLGATITSNLRACKLTSNAGLFCLDENKNVINWANPAATAAGRTLFNCGQIASLDASSTETCTGITVDPEGNIWLAGKSKGRAHSLLKIKNGACPAGSQTFDGVDSAGEPATYCSITWATGRPLLLDIEMITGDAADALGFNGNPLGEGLIGVQERKTVVFFPAAVGSDSPPSSEQIVDLGSGKTGWGLGGNEQLQGATLLQPAQSDVDFLLVTTNTGKVLARNLDTLTVAPWTTQLVCNPRLPQQFGIRSSTKTGFVYITNRQCKTVTAMGTDDSTGAAIPGVLPSEPVEFNPEGPTIAAGIGVNLLSAACTSAAGCEVTPGATLFSGAGDISGGSGLTLFQVKGIPDCRWDPDADACADKYVIVEAVTDGTCLRGTGGLPANCLTESLRQRLVDAGDDDIAGTLFLNVTPLLPSEITDLFSPNGLPPLLISPQYRARDEDGYVFEAFFGIPEEGAVFTGTFGGEYELFDLVGRPTDCAALPASTPADQALAQLLDWDVVTWVSDVRPSVGGIFVDTMINTGCGSVETRKIGWSMVSYRLEVMPDMGPELAVSVEMPNAVVTGNDAVFARLLQQLYGELDYVLDELACSATIDTGGDTPPLTSASCSTLQSSLAFAKEKLDRCIEAAFEPKESASNQNCQSFESQYGTFMSAVDAAQSNCPLDPISCDPGNRKGEVAVRAQVLKHVYDFRFLPSIPRGGFCTEDETCP